MSLSVVEDGDAPAAIGSPQFRVVQDGDAPSAPSGLHVVADGDSKMLTPSGLKVVQDGDTPKSTALPPLPDFTNQPDENLGSGPVTTYRPPPSPQPSPSPGTLGSNAGSTVRPATPDESAAVPSLSSQDVQHIRQSQFTDAARQPEERQLENVGIHPAQAQDVAAQEFPDSDDPVGDALKYVRSNPQLSHPEARAAVASAEYQAGQRQQQMAQVATPETRPGLRQLNDVVGGVGGSVLDIAKSLDPDDLQKASQYFEAGTKTPGTAQDIGLRAIGSVAPYVFVPGEGWVQGTLAALGGIGAARGEIAQRRAAGQDIGPGQELAAAAGQGLINAATMKVGIGAGQNAAEAVGGGILRRAAVAIPATGAEMAGVNVAANAASNAIAASTYDPNRPIGQGTKEAVIGGLASGVPFGIHGAMHGGAESTPPTTPSDQPAPQLRVVEDGDQPKPPAQQTAAVQPWQQTRDQFVAGGGSPEQHQAAVNDALAQGKQVPANVLSDYARGAQSQNVSSAAPTLPAQQPPKARYSIEDLANALHPAGQSELRSPDDLRGNLQPGDQTAAAAEPRQAIQQAQQRQRVMTMSADQLNALSPDQLRSAAGIAGVRFDTRSMTIPRILDHQMWDRLNAMSSKDLWDAVRNAGQYASSRDQNIQTLMWTNRQPVNTVEGQPSGNLNSSQSPTPKAEPTNGPPQGGISQRGLSGEAENSAKSPTASEQPAAPDLSTLKRVELVKLAKSEGVRASGNSADIIAAIQEKRAQQPAAVSGGNAPAGDNAAQSARQPQAITRAAIEREILQSAEPLRPYTPTEGQAGEYGVISSRNMTFYKTLPGEVRDFLEGRPEARRLFRVTDNPSDAGGADAMAQMGDDYFNRIEQGAKSQLGTAKELLRESQDPRHQILAAVHDQLDALRAEKSPRPAQDAIDPATLRDGTEFTMFGHRFTVTEDADGVKVLKDGGEFPIVDAQGVGKIPADRGSVRDMDLPETATGIFEPDEVHQAMVESGADASRTAASVEQLRQESAHAAVQGNQSAGIREERSDAAPAGASGDRGPQNRPQPAPPQLTDQSNLQEDSHQRLLADAQASGIKPAGGGVDLFGRPTFDTKPGGQETFGFKQEDNAVIREQQRMNQRARDAVRADREAAAEAEASQDKQTGQIFPTQPTKDVREASSPPAAYSPAELRSMSNNDLRAVAEGHGIDAGNLAGGNARQGVIDHIVERQKSLGSSTEQPPQTGKLDRLEAWARKRLDDLGSPGVRGGIPLDPSTDPQRLAYLAVIGAAKIARGATKFAAWSKSMASDFAELTQAHLSRIWRESRRVATMDEDARADWFKAKVQIPQTESTKSIVRQQTGQTDTSQLIRETDALEASMKAMSRGSRAGYQSAVQQTTGLRKELARIAEETLPPDERGKLLNRVAQLNSLAGLRHGIVKVRQVLVERDARDALRSIEGLVGNAEMKIYTRPASATASKAPTPRVPGDVNPAELKTVNLSDLALDTRNAIRPLIDQARLIKSQLQRALTPGDGAKRETFTDAQVAATNKLREVEQQIRVLAANDLSQRQIETAGKIQTLKDVKDQAVQTIGAPPASGEVPSGEGPRDPSRLKALWRTQYSPDTILSNIFGEKHPAFDMAVPQMRWAREQKLSTIRDFHEGLEPKLVAAGIPSKSAALDRWLSNRELVNLPSGKQIKLTRPEMLDLYGHQGDEQTSKLIDNGIGWKFEQAKQAEPIKLTRDDIEHITSQLTPEEKAIVDHFKDFRDKLFPAAAAARLSLGQSAPDKIEGNYPRARDVQQEPMPTGWRGVVQRRLENVSSQKERGADRVSPVLIRNAFEVMADDIHDTADLIHVAEPLHNTAAVLQHPDVANALARKFGPQVNRQVDQFLFDAAEQKARPPANALDRVWRWLASRYSTAALTLNPNTLAKHYLGGSVMASSQFDPRDWQAGMIGAHKPGTYERMLKTSGSMWSRFEGENGLYTTFSPLFERKVTPEAKLGFTAALQRGKIGQAFAAIPLLKNNDAAIHKQAFVATENYIDRTQPGLSGEARRRAVLDKFIEATERTQTGNNPTSISYTASKARESGPIQQALMLFTTAANKRLNMLARWGQLGGSQRARLLASLGASALLTSGATYGIKRGASAIGSALAGGTPDDKDQARRDTNNFAWNVVGNATDMSYAGAYLTDIAREFAQRGRVDSDSQVGGMVRNAISGTANVVNALTRQLQTPAGTKKATIARQRVMTAFATAQDPFREMFGDPTLPLTRLGGQALRAADYQPKATKYVATGAEPEIKQLAASGNAQGARGMYEQNRIGLPSVARMLESAKLDDAVNLLNILTPKDRQSPGLPDRTARMGTGARTLVDQLRDRIGRSNLPADQQDELLRKAGVTPPAHLSLEREFRDLASKASRAKASGDELSPDDADRLKDLRSYQSQRTKILNGDDPDDLRREELDELSNEFSTPPQPASTH